MGESAAKVAAIAIVLFAPAAGPLPNPTLAPVDEGREAIVPDSRRPTVAAAFARESYRPNRIARLVFTDQATPAVTMEIYRAGTDSAPLRANDVMRGTAVTEPLDLGPVKRLRAVKVTIGRWASGVYFAKLTAPGGRIGYAPFVLAPRVLGVHDIGVEYFHNDRGQRREPWVIRASSANDWLLSGSGLTPGSRISSGGIEADRITTSSPRNITIVAQIPNLYGPGLTPQMTYYETRRGARVFAAGAFGLTGAVVDPRVARLLANLWSRMADPPAAEKSLPDQPETLTAP